MTTGKNKEQFRKWYFDNDMNAGGTLMDLLSFYHLPFEMKIGVYLAYYDSIEKKITNNFDAYNRWHCLINYKKINDNRYKTRNEAYKEAFKTADEMINQKD